MTQSVSTPWTFYVGDNSTTIFAFPWYLQAASELEVYVAGSLTTAYTLSGLQSPTGGTITFFTAPTSGQVLFLRRLTPQTQLTDYISNDPFDAQAHEAALDKLTREIQDLDERLSRRPALLTTIANAYRNLLFPAAAPETLIGWNAAADALTLYQAAIAQVTPDPVSGLAYAKATATISASNGQTTLTASALIPSGAKVLGVTYRNLVAWSATGGLTSIDLGGMSVVNGWGSGLAITNPLVTNYGYFTREDEPIAHQSEDVTLTARGGTFGATGSCKVTVHLVTLTPDT